MIQELKDVREALEKIACLGNGDRHGNSDGNIMAIAIIAKLDALIAAQEKAEPVAWNAMTQPSNFCPRCGKRRGGDVNYIHTCTPPRGLEMT